MSPGLAQQYRGAWRQLNGYWRSYGGSRALLYSPYVHLSGILLIATYGTWSEPGWWSQVSAVLPNIIGFSLAGMAIYLSVGSEQFRERISGQDPGDGDRQEASPFIVVTAAFAHFIVAQVMALIASITLGALASAELLCKLEVCLALNDFARMVLWAFGYWAFLYAVLLVIGTTLALFRVAGWFDEYVTHSRTSGADSGGKTNV